MQHQGQGQQQTGTRNDTYDVIAVLYHALQGAENCQIYLKDAQDGDLRQFFEQARDAQRQLADRGKQVLHKLLMNQEQSGGSAFGWQSSQGQAGSSTQDQSSFAQQGAGQPTGGSSF